jgi:hypothetical protein
MVLEMSIKCTWIPILKNPCCSRSGRRFPESKRCSMQRVEIDSYGSAAFLPYIMNSGVWRTLEYASRLMIPPLQYANGIDSQ